MSTITLNPGELRQLEAQREAFDAGQPVYIVIEGEPVGIRNLDRVLTIFTRVPARWCVPIGEPCEMRGMGVSGYDWRESDGSVLVATSTVEVLPVVNGHNEDRPSPPYVAIYAHEMTAVFISGLGDSLLNLNKLPVPGRDWIVKLDRVVLAP